MPAPRPTPLALYGALLAHTAASAGTYLFAKRALLELHWAQLALLRFACASLIFVALLLRLPRAERLPPPGVRKRLLWLSLVAVPINQGFFLGGLQLSTTGHAALLYALTPLFVILLAQLLLGERPSRRTVAGGALALSGALFVLLSRQAAQGALGSGPLLGDGFILCAVLAWAVYTAEGRALVGQFGALRMISWTLVGGTILFLPVGLWFSVGTAAARAQVLAASPAAWVGIAWLVLVTSVLSYLLWYWALGHLPAARVAVFANLQPPATAALAHFWLGEEVTVPFLAGTAVVIAGVLLAQSRRPSDKPPPAGLADEANQPA